MSERVGKTLGPYQILEQIGQGGMAAVYKAYHAPTDRNVAVKVLPSEVAKDPTFVTRFDREAKAIASLQHIHILPVFDYGEDNGTHYLVMPYVPTGTLEDYLDGGRLGIDETVRLFCQIAEAVDYAHQKGILHRDLKPANVLLDTSSNALLSDFGLARLMDTSSSLTGAHIMGTPLYMSPEQGQGTALDSRSDIYSLGVILFEMVVGAPPFVADTPMSVIYKNIHEPPPSPRLRRPDLPEGIEQVILKALAKHPHERFSTAGEMAMTLRRAIAEAPTTVGETEPDNDDLLTANTFVAEDDDLLHTVLGEATHPAASPATQPPPAPSMTKPDSTVPAETPAQAERTPVHIDRRVRLLAWGAGIILVVIVGLFALRSVFVSAAMQSADGAGANMALSLASAFGVDVNERLVEEVLSALDARDTERAVRLAKLYADRKPKNGDLSATLQQRARDAAVAGQPEAALRTAEVLAGFDPDGATALAGEFNDAGINALLQTPPQESLARIYLDTVSYLDETLGIERSNSEQSASLVNQAQLAEQDDPEAALSLYHEAIRLDSLNLGAYYALSSLLLTRFADDSTLLDEAVEVAQSGQDHIESHFCQGQQDLADEVVFTKSWLCFLLMTTEAGARIERGDNPQLIMPIVERAVRLAETNGQFGPGYYTAEAYYYLARLTEPSTQTDVLCSIIENRNRDLERHTNWALYANEQLGDRQCLPG